MKKSPPAILYIIFILIFLLTACSPEETDSGSEPVTIKIAVLPVLDTLPMYVAAEKDLYSQYNIIVEFVPAGSAPKRDELVNSGQVDGMINEIVSTVFYNRQETRVQIVRYARIAASDSPIFRILASGVSGITTVEELKRVPIGISQGTVIEYLTDRLLQAEEFSSNDINKVAVPDIGQRMALLASGELDAAMLPDPLASLAVSQGAVVVVEDSSHPEYSHSVYTFRKEFINQHPKAIRGFLAAIEEAVQLINENPQQFKDLLSQRELVPPQISDAFSVPTFVTASVPTQNQWDDVIEWINTNGLGAGNAAYNQSITSEFLP